MPPIPSHHAINILWQSYAFVIYVMPTSCQCAAMTRRMLLISCQYAINILWICYEWTINLSPISHRLSLNVLPICHHYAMPMPACSINPLNIVCDQGEVAVIVSPSPSYIYVWVWMWAQARIRMNINMNGYNCVNVCVSVCYQCVANTV